MDPVVLGSIENVYLQEGGTGYGSTNIVDFHRRPNVGISTVIFKALLKPIIINGSIADVQILASGKDIEKTLISSFSGKGNLLKLVQLLMMVELLEFKFLMGAGYGDETQLELRNRGIDAKFIADVHEWKINQVVKMIISSVMKMAHYCDQLPIQILDLAHFNVSSKKVEISTWR